MQASFLLLTCLGYAQARDWRYLQPESYVDGLQSAFDLFDSYSVKYTLIERFQVSGATQYPTCRSLLDSPRFATMNIDVDIYAADVTLLGFIPFLPRGVGQQKITLDFETMYPTVPSIDNLKKCCAPSCGGKIFNIKVYLLDVYLFWNKGLFAGGSNRNIYNNLCVQCDREDGGPRNCTDGQYATEVLQLDDEGVVKNYPLCKPCPPGTWMTCAEKSHCTWPIPLALSDYNPGRDFWMPKNPDGKYYTPIGTCLPCVSAGSSKSHYGDDPSKSSFIEATPSYEFTTTSPEARTVGLPWYCPGGNLAPRMCTIPDTHGDPLTSERCVCKAGFALTVSNTCATCPRGNRCKRGFAEACPDHSHQPNTGQIDCINCTSDGTERGVPTAYCGQSSQLRKCISVYKASPLLCVNCNQCRKMYLPNNAGGKVDCYN